VADRTRGRIRQLLAPGSIQPTDRLVLTNAIAFKGRWSAPFPERSTQPADFERGDRGQARVRLMTRTGELRYAEDARVQVLELPYGDGRSSMLVMLPRHSSDLVQLEKDFTDPVVSRWIARLAPRSVEVYMPRFRLEAHYDLEQVLPALGMPDAFDARRADFSRMDGLRDLFIGLVTHKAFVDVTEEGTEAAASTAVGMRTTSVAPEPPVRFRADHPFLFVIRDGRSGAVLFLGRLSKPG